MGTSLRKISVLLLLTVVLYATGTARPVQAASAWMFLDGSGEEVEVNGELVLEKNEYRNIDIYKNGKEIKENDGTYKVEWSSSDETVVWINGKSGKLRADKFGEMKTDEARAKITAKITNKKTGAVAKRSFYICVESPFSGPDMSVYPEWFVLPDATVKNRVAEAAAPAPGITLDDLVIYGTKTMYFGEEGYLYAEGKREDGSVGRIPLDYEITDPSILSVSADGTVTTLKPGTTRVTVSLKTSPMKYSYTLTVEASHYNAVKGQTEGVGAEEQKAAQVVLDFIRKNIKSDMSDYDKVKLVHDFIVQNTEYKNRGNERDHMVFGPLLDGYAVCEGYAKAFDLFMYALDIDCITVSGYAGEPHAWNIVWVDGVPYHLDATWDDPAGGRKATDAVSYEYFLLPEAYITKTHSFILSDYPYCDDTYYTYYHFRNNLIASVADFDEKFIELFAENPKEVVILYPENQMPDDDVIYQQNGGKGYSYSVDGDGNLPRLGEYTILRIMESNLVVEY